MNILVTAGPTREAIDPVRFLSNRSSGKMGYAIAEAAVAGGHNVRLVSGPVSLAPPRAAETYAVESAADMLEAVLASFGWCDVLIMCAAVADWRPSQKATHKIKKKDNINCLQLERTADILQEVAAHKQKQIVVGFAAETRNMIEEARRKLDLKKLDLIVANDVSRSDAGFAADTNAVTLITSQDMVELPLMPKSEVARKILLWIESADTSSRQGS